MRFRNARPRRDALGCLRLRLFLPSEQTTAEKSLPGSLGTIFKIGRSGSPPPQIPITLHEVERNIRKRKEEARSKESYHVCGESTPVRAKPSSLGSRKHKCTDSDYRPPKYPGLPFQFVLLPQEVPNPPDPNTCTKEIDD